jgi:hypothetical protein
VKKVPQIEPKFPSWEMLMQLLAARGLLADEKLGPPLLGLWSLHGQQVIVPLGGLMVPAELGDSSLENLLLLQKVMKMRSPLGWVIQPWVDLLVEPPERPQDVLPWLLLQMSG